MWDIDYSRLNQYSKLDHVYCWSHVRNGIHLEQRLTYRPYVNKELYVDLVFVLLTILPHLHFKRNNDRSFCIAELRRRQHSRFVECTDKSQEETSGFWTRLIRNLTTFATQYYKVLCRVYHVKQVLSENVPAWQLLERLFLIFAQYLWFIFFNSPLLESWATSPKLVYQCV